MGEVIVWKGVDVIGIVIERKKIRKWIIYYSGNNWDYVVIGSETLVGMIVVIRIIFVCSDTLIGIMDGGIENEVKEDVIGNEVVEYESSLIILTTN